MSFDFTQINNDFQSVLEYLRQEYLQISTGRANPALLDGVNVDSYGTFQPIKNIASINLEDARTMNVVPWDKSQIQDIEKALHDSNLPFSISVGESSVRVNIPQLTEESKRSLAKLLKEKLEDARIKIRNVRQESIKQIDAMEKDGDISEDAKNNYKEELQKKVDDCNAKLSELFDNKEADIMKV